jgi:hypothetical protein
MAYTDSSIVGSVTLPANEMKYEVRLANPANNMYVVHAISRSVYDRDDSPDHEITDPADDRSEAAGAARTVAILSAPQTIPGKFQSLAAADTNGVIDVMFIFTPQALASVGGTQSAMQALVAMSVQMANDAYRNSNSPIRMRSVGVASTIDPNYVEKSFNDELTRMRYSGDGYLDADMARRATLGADAVVLFVAENSYCGLGYQTASSADQALAVVCTQCPDSVAHEVGHNIGLNHDRVTAHDYDQSKYNFGYCWDTSATTCSRSVMAYSGECCLASWLACVQLSRGFVL